MIRERRDIVSSIFIFIFISMVYVSLSQAQFSGFTLFPFDTAIAYEDLVNPFLFSPGLRTNAFTGMELPFLPTWSFNPWLDSYSFFNVNPFTSLSLYSPFTTPFLSPFDTLSMATPWTSIQPLFLTPTIPVNPLSLTSLIPRAAPSSVSIAAPTRMAAQTGAWLGTWQSTYIAYIVLFHTGPMTLNIVVDPLLGTAIGTCILQGSRYANLVFNVSGVEANNLISLTGFLGVGYDIYLDGVLTSATTMNGSYTVLGPPGSWTYDTGVFNLTLI